MLSIPHSVALAQNSGDSGRLYIGNKENSGCTSCRYTSNAGSTGGTAAKPLNIRGIISGQNDRKAARYRSYGTGSATYSLNYGYGGSSRESLSALSEQNRRRELENIMKLSRERKERVDAERMRLLEQQNYYERKIREQSEQRTASADNNGRASATSRNTRQVYSKNYRRYDPPARETGSRVFLSPR
jgi:hypothetical protein